MDTNKKAKYKKIINEMLNDYDFFNTLLGSDDDYNQALSKINTRATEIEKATKTAINKINKK